MSTERWDFVGTTGLIYKLSEKHSTVSAAEYQTKREREREREREKRPGVGVGLGVGGKFDNSNTCNVYSKG